MSRLGNHRSFAFGVSIACVYLDWNSVFSGKMLDSELQKYKTLDKGSHLRSRFSKNGSHLKIGEANDPQKKGK